MKWSDKIQLQAYGIRHGVCNDIGLGTASLIAAGIGATTAGIQMTVGGKMNQRAAHEARRAREWQTKEREASQEYQQQYYEQQLADNERLYNQYQSPEAQARQMREAGFSPLAALNGSMALTNGPSAPNPSAGPSAPGASLPQVFNNSEAIAQAGQFFNNALNAIANQQKSLADIEGTRADVAYKNALTQTENALRDGKVELMGSTIELQGSRKDLNKEQRKNLAAQTVKLNKETEAVGKYLQMMDTQIDIQQMEKQMKAFDLDKQSQRYMLEWAERNNRIVMMQQSVTNMKSENEVLGQQLTNMQSTNEILKAQKVSVNYQNRIMGDYVVPRDEYKDLNGNPRSFAQLHMQNQYDYETVSAKKLENEYERQRYHPATMTYLKAMDAISATGNAVGSFLVPFAQMTVANSMVQRNNMLMQNAQNPVSSGLNGSSISPNSIYGTPSPYGF